VTVTVTVTVALDVGAPVMVAALGNRNEIVKVFDAVRRSRVDELRQHALEQVDAAFVRLALEQLIEFHDLVNVELLKVQHASDIGRSLRRLRARSRA
jgi:hypothetical protein